MREWLGWGLLVADFSLGSVRYDPAPGAAAARGLPARLEFKDYDL